MASFMALKLACIVLVYMAVGVPQTVADITCEDVRSRLVPCISFLFGGTNTIPEGCCDGIKSLNAAAQTTADRQQACKCLKSAAASITGIDYGRASELPRDCKVNTPYKISPETDCKSVK